MIINPKKARLRLGLSINDMSDACGVHRQTWVKWERGEREPGAAVGRLINILLWLNDNDILSDCLENLY